MGPPRGAKEAQDTFFNQYILYQNQLVRWEWTVWYTEKKSKYRNRVVYRRTNPFWVFYFLSAMYGGAFAIGIGFPFSNTKSFLELTGMSPSGTYWGWVGIASMLSLAIAGTIASRSRYKVEEEPREDAYYPPKGYWEAVKEDNQ